MVSYFQAKYAVRIASACTRSTLSSIPARALHSSTARRFEPVANASPASPMRRKVTWLDAVKAKEEGRLARPDPNNVHLEPSDIPRTMQDSYTTISLPFAEDEWLLDAYVNTRGKLRIGQIFQDLDALAGVIAYNHCKPADPTIVTASVDRISLLKRLTELKNVELAGNVTWTGRSSMEITIRARTVPDNEVFLTANFTFVARHPITLKSFPINPLIPQNETEQHIFDRAEQYNKAKRLAAKTSLLSAPPNTEESGIIHAMWLRQQAYEDVNSGVEKPADVVMMKDTEIKSTMFMQPQYRNRHSYMIFGGYLLRQTFELAYCCAAACSHGVPQFLSLDQTTFRAPVPVGSVLYLTASVAYTSPQVEPKSGTLIQVRVDSTVFDIKHGTSTSCGSFTYTYFIDKAITVLPVSYDEGMKYLEGRRRAIESRKFGNDLLNLNDTGMLE
ncbi:HotDog domain-containing protein [Dipodascopsis tothii]|uniref:HotDog domain-containing protein n=1 Tax=Dipodascopsis tothii TaxID=44089 RepID=UPI0034CDC99F